jgi:uncharacterized repeat protein (TIGR01451 family)
VTVKNVGTDAASDVSLVSYLSEALSVDKTVVSNPSMTCALGEYGELNCALPSLGAGNSATVTLTVTRVMAREAWLDAWASSPADEANYDNNYSGVYLDPDRSNPADVAVEMTAPEQPEPGEDFTYSSTVTDRGPETARDVKFSQQLSDGVDFVSVTSSDPSDDCVLHEDVYDAEGVEGGPYTYREVRCSLGDMRFADQATITVTATRNDPHELWSSAWVSTSSFDGNYENDWADASTAGHPSVTSDLAMTLTSSNPFPLVGDDATYTMEVTNLGPAPATDVTLDSWLSQELAMGSITPTRAGDACELNDYQGITCTLGNMAVGETAKFVVDTTRVRAREFWFGGSVWSTNYDPNYENNYVELNTPADESTPADLGVDIEGPEDPPVGSAFDYTVKVTNHGPQGATAVQMTTPLPDGTTFVSAASPDDGDLCTLYEETFEGGETGKLAEGGAVSYTYREVRCDLGTLVPAESATVTVTLTRDTEYEFWTTAWATTASFDGNYDNDFDSLGASGKIVPGCGAAESPTGDGIVVCDEASGGGDAYADRYVISSAAGPRAIMSGAGNDTITVNIPTSSKRHRRVVVQGGRGRDTITVQLAPGAGHVTVILKGGRGRDTLEVLAPRPGKRFNLRMRGGTGSDSCSTSIQGSQRSRSC